MENRKTAETRLPGPSLAVTGRQSFQVSGTTQRMGWDRREDWERVQCEDSNINDPQSTC